MSRRTVSLLLAVASIALGAAACGSSEPETAQPEPAPVEPAPDETAAGGTMPKGKVVFTSAGCAGCHTLSDAGASGEQGPNLDETKPSAEKVVEAVTTGHGSAFADLPEADVQEVAAYVVAATADQ